MSPVNRRLVAGTRKLHGNKALIEDLRHETGYTCMSQDAYDKDMDDNKSYFQERKSFVKLLVTCSPYLFFCDVFMKEI